MDEHSVRAAQGGVELPARRARPTPEPWHGQAARAPSGPHARDCACARARHCANRSKSSKEPRPSPEDFGGKVFQSLENMPRFFQIIGKLRRIFPTIGKKFSNHWKTFPPPMSHRIVQNPRPASACAPPQPPAANTERAEEGDTEVAGRELRARGNLFFRSLALVEEFGARGCPSHKLPQKNLRASFLRPLRVCAAGLPPPPPPLLLALLSPPSLHTSPARGRAAGRPSAASSPATAPSDDRRTDSRDYGKHLRFLVFFHIPPP